MLLPPPVHCVSPNRLVARLYRLAEDRLHASTFLTRGLSACIGPSQSSSLAQRAAPKDHRKIIVVTGPTAVGKTRVSLELAKRLGGEIVSADSVQVYRGLDIGSDKVFVPL